ncbi:transglycosylase SLT domain-containing protein [Epibacterium sp. SM1969]|uniref:Transglycosylase SLT domain-containing protein n=1 Tax=Tritonibacter aquimaris TaxID=2663379 RepID=A0A844ARE6_9RHOB|nr:lytic transglycosylase domain-containing protein [Tritonibacter aquimaris]MQY41688.1 transglycosylase SLT domain-containing protein [Tritonibacter aquimaris]
MFRRDVITGVFWLALVAGCGAAETEAPARPAEPPLYPNETPELRQKINFWADHYEVPRSLVHRLAIRESTHRPWAVNRPYYGLLQILPATARSMGFKGQPQDLLDADTNLEFAVKYLRGAWLISDGSQDMAVKHYSRGYYHEAKRRGMLKETGLRP